MRAKDMPLFLRKETAPRIGKDFFGPSPSVFVGHYGYPLVNVGPMGALQDRKDIDNPALWLDKSYAEIIFLRSQLIRSQRKQSVRSTERFVGDVQNISMAVNSPDIEISFRKQLVPKMVLSTYVQPMGPAGKIEKFRIAGNPKIPRKTESVVTDDLKANKMASLLYEKGQDVYKITGILSSGIMGIDKKIVPTRWSITAVDDILAKHMLHSVRSFKEVKDFFVFESHKLDNKFVALLIPGQWEFENFEAWQKGSSWNRSENKWNIEEEYEPFGGRTAYAEKEGGGYYASRFAVVEHLCRIRKQARVVVFRETYEGYSVPLGVWVVRQVVRNAFSQPGKKFSTLEEALEYVEARLHLPLERYRKQSRVLQQKRLNGFFVQK